MAAKRSKQAPLLSAFISHAKADEKKARAIADSLESRGFKCWIAPRDVRAGRSYGDEIIRGIESTRSFVLVLSKASNDSAFVAREVERAVSKKKPIFAVRIANIEPAPSLELFISGTQWIDAFSGRLGLHVDRLAALLAEEEGAAPVAPAARTVGAEPRRLPKWAGANRRGSSGASRAWRGAGPMARLRSDVGQIRQLRSLSHDQTGLARECGGAGPAAMGPGEFDRFHRAEDRRRQAGEPSRQKLGRRLGPRGPRPGFPGLRDRIGG
ncbi:MAG: toll/interleukin-1 receptor domain-containing protein [Methyloceanibacter sp.]|nr:toll/interleukin-1 receptor domain-containing protein [Methyloceanibacter sp.]